MPSFVLKGVETSVPVSTLNCLGLTIRLADTGQSGLMNPAETSATMSIDWDKLQSLALAEVEHLLDSLPGPLKERAQSLPVTFERKPNRRHQADGIEPDTLGLFVGPDFSDQETTSFPLPPQIILFLENLWEEAEQNEEYYQDEVRTTYMHELGHYLGLNEDDLFDRGLE